MLAWVLLFSCLFLYLLLLRQRHGTHLTYTNGLFHVQVNNHALAVVDTGSVYTVLHEFHPHRTYDHTIAFGSQTSKVFFEERELECISTSRRVMVGVALPQRQNSNLLGLGKGNAWAPRVRFDFSQLQMVFNPDPLPVQLQWVSPPHLPAHAYVLPLEGTNVSTACKYLIIDTGSNLTSVPARAFQSLLLLARSHQPITFTIQGHTYEFPPSLYRWANGSLLVKSDSPWKDTIVLGGFFLRTSRLYVDPTGCCWDLH